MRLSRYALLLAVVVLTAGAWSDECWAQAKVARVGGRSYYARMR